MKPRLSALTGAILFPLLLWLSIGMSKAAGAVPVLTVDVCPGGGCAYSTIQEAVAAVPDSGIINLLAGTYTENLVITKSLTLQGQGPDVTVIDGGGRDTVILIDDVVAVTIKDVTIQNGRSLEGGGIFNPDGTVTITNSVIQNNDATCGEGGGILNLGTIVLQDVLITGNKAAFGGGLLNDDLLLGRHITITQNSAADILCEGITGYGGGIDNSGTVSLTGAFLGGNTAVNDGGAVENAGILTLTLSLFENNQSQTKGGGLDNVANSQAAIHQSTFRLNKADYGGGLNNEGTMQLTSSTVFSNTAVLTGSGGGGGLRNEMDGSLVVTNSTISGNMSGDGGGLLNDGAGATAVFRSSTIVNNFGVNAGGIYNVTGSVSLNNTIVAEQWNGRDCGGSVVSEGSNLDSDNTCLLGAGDLRGISQPFIGPLQDNGGPTWTHALLIGSPAIDASSVCESTDQRGVLRPLGTACDIGAYETFAHKVYLPSVLR